MTTGEKLTKLRKEKNYTQEDLADILGVSRQSVSKWESDQSFPETNNLRQLSKLYGVTLDYLLNDEAKESVLETKKDNIFLSKRMIVLYYSAGIFILFLLIYLFPVLNQDMGYYSVNIDMYNILGASNYQLGNYLCLIVLLLQLANLLMGICYVFYEKEKLFLSKLIVSIIEAAFWLLIILFFIGANVMIGIFFDFAFAIVQVVGYLILKKKVINV